jgi:dynein heavy chain
MAALPEALGAKADAREKLEALFTWLIDPCVSYVRHACKELVATADINLPVSLMQLLGSLLFDMFEPPSAGRPAGGGAALPAKELHKLLEGCFVFALVWSIGGSTGK